MNVFVIFYSVFCIIFWFAILGIISFLGGWYFLAKKYPLENQKRLTQKTYFMQSMNLGKFTSYRSIINISFFEDGIKFSPILFFKFLHKPIFITWDNIKKCKYSKFIFIKTVFILDDKRVVIYGRSAKYIQEKLKL